MNSVRKALLIELLSVPPDLEHVLNRLAGFPWDSEPLVTLSRGDMEGALERFIDRNISASELEAWAEAIESRDDIELPSDSTLREVLSVLANPMLNCAFTELRAQQLLAKLRSPG